MIKAFCDWLSSTGLSQFLQSVSWIVPSVQSIHILTVSFVMAAMVMLNLRLVGVTGRGQTVSDLAQRFLPGLTPAILILAATGIVLTIAEPERELMNTVFRLKMLLVLLAIFETLWFSAALKRQGEAWNRVSPPVSARIAGLVALALWLAIATCGRWIAYTQN